MKKYISDELNKADVTTFNGMCHYLLDPRKKDIGPLLKHYDQMDKYTDIKMPSQSMLNLDQQFFQKFIEKMKRAHDYELGLIKKKYTEAAENLITKEVSRLQNLVASEFRRFAEREDDQRDYSLQ